MFYISTFPFPAKSFKTLAINNSLNLLQLKPCGIFAGIQSLATIPAIFLKRLVCVIPKRVHRKTEFRPKRINLNDRKDPKPFRT